MEKEKYFIIYFNEFTGDGSTKDDTWKIGSKFFESYEEAIIIYEKASSSHSCKICKTIYG